MESSGSDFSPILPYTSEKTKEAKVIGFHTKQIDTGKEIGMMIPTTLEVLFVRREGGVIALVGRWR